VQQDKVPSVEHWMERFPLSNENEQELIAA